MKIYKIEGKAPFLTDLGMDIQALIIANDEEEAKSLAREVYVGKDVKWRVIWDEEVRSPDEAKVLDINIR